MDELRERLVPRRHLAVQSSVWANGCIERFFRTLKEQVLWLRRFHNLEELRVALVEFRDRYNHNWILGRLNYRTPAQARRDFQLELEVAA